MLRYNTATLTANVSEKVRILAENGQIPLAYMTARAHGLDEFTKTLENTLIESEEYDHERIFKEAEKYAGNQSQRAKALLPLRPIFLQDGAANQGNWPMINKRAEEAKRAAQMFVQKAAADNNDDMFFQDAKEYHTSNQQVGHILAGKTAP